MVTSLQHYSDVTVGLFVFYLSHGLVRVCETRKKTTTEIPIWCALKGFFITLYDPVENEN